MKTAILYSVIVALSAGMAVLVFHDKDQEDDDTPSPEMRAAFDPTLEDPTWYRHVTSEERLASARYRLDRMASTIVAARDIGPMKDELALLTRDPAVVDLIVRDFQQRREFSAADISAFMEIFARAKNPRFEPLLREAIAHPEYEPQLNAVDAAAVQRDPALVPALKSTLDGADERLELRIVNALAAIGGGAALQVMIDELEDFRRETLLTVIPLLVRAGAKEAIPALRRVAARDEADIAVIAAFALAGLGLDEGKRQLEKIILDPTVEELPRAQALQFYPRISGSSGAAFLRDVLEARSELVRFEARVALLRLDDENERRKVLEDLASDDADARIQAIGILGRTGYDRDARAVTPHLTSMSPGEIYSFLSSLAAGRPSNAVDIVEDIAKLPGNSGIAGIRRFHDYGLASLPALTRLLDHYAENGAMLEEIVAAIASLASPEAMKIIESWSPKTVKLALLKERAIRTIDLELVKVGV